MERLLLVVTAKPTAVLTAVPAVCLQLWLLPRAPRGCQDACRLR